MGINPVKFGKDVIDQFGRYLRNTFPIADEEIAQQLNEKLRHSSDSLIAKGPYVYLNKPFVEGMALKALIDELKLHKVLGDIFPFPSLHIHQERAIRAIDSGKNLIVSTGTGSGKTESFLLPIFDACLKANEEGLEEGVMAIIVYPMNALVNDQLERLRPMLAGTGVTFGRYTGETPQTTGGKEKLEHSRAYTKSELDAYATNHDELPLPFEECYSRAEITERKPRILLTNYSQLEYLLLRDKDLDLFHSRTLKFMVLDEVHTYTGELGSEMACLLRRIKGLIPERITCIGTSATVANEDSTEIITTFASELFGETKESFEVVEEEYKDSSGIDITYKPDINEQVIGILEEIIEEVHDIYLQDEVTDISDRLLVLAEKLSGYTQGYRSSNNIEKLGELLVHNSYIRTIESEFSSPREIVTSFPRLKTIANRKQASNGELEAELLAYLMLGAIAKYDGEPVLRPKLHYFVKGLYGASAVIGSDNKVKLYFETPKETEWFHYNFKACRNCGQHYFGVVTEENAIKENGVGVYKILRNMSDYEHYAEGEEKGWYLTDKLNRLDEDSDDGMMVYVCKHCAAIHTSKTEGCSNPRCRNSDALLAMHAYHHDWKRCASCSTSTKKGTLSVISDIKSVEVFDIMIMGQSMLSAMPQKELQKLLIFADSRQDAAFQAGWMSARSKRFHLRYLNYEIVKHFKSDFDDAISYDTMVEKLMEQSIYHKVFSKTGFKAEELNKRVRWYMLEEYCSTARTKSSIEKLGLVKLVYEGLNDDTAFLQDWAEIYGCGPEDISGTIVLILDYFRSLGAIDDAMAKRLWTYADVEVRNGIINYVENKYPAAFVYAKSEILKEKFKFIKSFKSGNGRSSVEVLVKKALGADKNNEAFIESVWDYLIDNELIVESKLIVKRQGSLAPLLHGVSQKTYQINKNIIGFQPAGKIYQCRSCKNVTSVMPRSGSCIKYHCKGKVYPAEIDSDNYDVVQYTQMHYTPMRSEEHSAQVPKEARDEHEKEFKSVDGNTNCLVATPTLEMGVDIGKLEMVLMRNVPPSTPNYTQRAGRAGRRHRIATVFTYARSTPHDTYFFNNPPEMITGDIKIPTFSMRNQPLVRKHIHSAVLTWLRMHADEKELQVVQETFPTYIKSYISIVNDAGKREFKDRVEPFDAFSDLLKKHFEGLNAFVVEILLSVWPKEERAYIDEAFISTTIKEMPKTLLEHIENLFLEIKTYRNLLKPLRALEVMSKSEEKEFRSFSYALNSYLYDSQGNYTLSYLATDGFFPSYAMGRESVKAQCADPLLEISRPKAVAIRELTPANKLYANRDIFDITGLNFYRLKEKNPAFTSDMIRKQLILNTTNGSVTEFGGIDRDGGDNEYKYFGSYEMVDVTLKQAQQIDDIKDSRVRLGFQMSGMKQPLHKGGDAYKINEMDIQYLLQGSTRLINLGLYGQEQVGFPICPKCGAVRNPRASESEITDFMKHHMESCRVQDMESFWSALHADIQSDLLVFDEFREKAEAVNFMEALKIGAYRLLDMQEGDLDATIEMKSNDAYRVIFFDPLPGGSGFLPLFFELYTRVIDQSLTKLKDCDCEESCYKCMLSFTNQQHHSVLNRFEAMDVLERYKFKPVHKNSIPPVVHAVDAEESEEECDSDAECAFIKYLEKKDFPRPDEQQYRVELGGGSFTLADFAYREKKVLVFIDGLSEGIHGNPQQAAKDEILRAKAKMKGFNIVALSAQAMKDEEYMAMIMEMISVYLSEV